MSFRPMTENESMICPPFDFLVSRYPGVKSITEECNRIYPDQLNPLQIQSLVKSWRGGPDPLDYISMFDNQGDFQSNVLPHWHYVSYGLSDLHCDGRLFEPNMFGQGKSGFGFELTFRLMKYPGEKSPPTWPARLMQSLARYVFGFGHSLLPGDHISWHQGMNMEDPSHNTELRQILLTRDAQLKQVTNQAGNVEFVQIIPVTTDELLSVQKWSVNSFLELMRQAPQCGGQYLVTDMSRVHSIFQLKPELEQDLMAGISQDGSDLSGVNASVCSWTPEAWKFYDESNVGYLKPEYQNLFHQLNKKTRTYEPSGQAASGMNQLLEDQFDDYRSPASIESLSSNGSHDSEEQSHDSDEKGCHSMSQFPYDAKTDKDLATSFSEISTLPPNTHQANANFNTIQGNPGPQPTFMSYPSSVFAPNVAYFDLMHITLNLEAGFCLPLALTGRMRHGRHFTFKGTTCNNAITMVAPDVEGAYVNSEKPFGAYGAWLQIFMHDGLVNAMVQDFHILLSTQNVAYPKTFLWPEWNFGLTLVI